LLVLTGTGVDAFVRSHARWDDSEWWLSAGFDDVADGVLHATNSILGLACRLVGRTLG
jgi:hypothetical protein